MNASSFKQNKKIKKCCRQKPSSHKKNKKERTFCSCCKLTQNPAARRFHRFSYQRLLSKKKKERKKSCKTKLLPAAVLGSGSGGGAVPCVLDCTPCPRCKGLYRRPAGTCSIRAGGVGLHTQGMPVCMRSTWTPTTASRMSSSTLCSRVSPAERVNLLFIATFIVCRLFLLFFFFWRGVGNVE